MSAEFWVAVIGAVFVGIAQIVTLIFNRLDARQRSKEAQVALAQRTEHAAKLEEVRVDVNSKASAALAASRELGEAVGELRGRDVQQPPHASPPTTT